MVTRRGFTLLETLIGLAITGMLLGCLAWMLIHLAHFLFRQEETLDSLQASRQIFRALERDLFRISVVPRRYWPEDRPPLPLSLGRTGIDFVVAKIPASVAERVPVEGIRWDVSPRASGGFSPRRNGSVFSKVELSQWSFDLFHSPGSSTYRLRVRLEFPRRGLSKEVYERTFRLAGPSGWDGMGGFSTSVFSKRLRFVSGKGPSPRSVWGSLRTRVDRDPGSDSELLQIPLELSLPHARSGYPDLRTQGQS